MIVITVLLFSLVILIGLYMAYQGLRHRTNPKVAALLHAGGATLAVIMLLTFIIRSPTKHMMYNLALTLFIMALLGGLVLLALRDGKRPPPMIVVALHALMGLIGYWFLLKQYFTL